MDLDVVPRGPGLARTVRRGALVALLVTLHLLVGSPGILRSLILGFATLYFLVAIVTVALDLAGPA